MDEFKLMQERDIPELCTHARLFRHEPTGAEICSLENDDENKVFGITFRTPPPDSTGLPHIMEHAVLAGSEKYPARDPFIELMKGSLATFVNAMTFPDMTTYPIASQNVQDFYNLIDVYVDAVLHPLITRQTLMQEGWHYELENLDAPLTYKGVVFNEMKGAYSAPEGLLSKYSTEALFPDHPYGRDSGGDPRNIPDLTYEQFKAFHDIYYHPSNAKIFFYGNDDPEERLRRVSTYLKGFQAITIDSAIPLQLRFQEPKWLEYPYNASVDENERKGMITVNWMLTEASDPLVALSLAILNHILIGTPASPLRKALIGSGLGEDLAGDGLETYLRQNSYSVGLKGIAPEEAGKVEALVLGTLTNLAREGIDPETIEASLNTVEFHLRENNTGQFPRGLVLMLRALSNWLHGSDPFARLAFEAPLSTIKSHLDSGEHYFEDMIQNLWLENPHRVTLLLRPDPQLHLREQATETERLLNERKGMNDDQILQVFEAMHELRIRQETPESPEVLAKIPTLLLEDLEQKNKVIPIQEMVIGGSKLLVHDIFTNGIVYLDMGFDLRFIPQDLLPLVHLFGRALVEIGTQKEDFVRLSQRIGRSTGGIQTATFISAVNHSKESTAWLLLRGKATLDQVGELFDILRDVLLTVKLDNVERFRQMVLEEKAELEASLTPAGTRFVNLRLRAHFDQAGWLAEQTSGISYLFFLRKLVEAVETDWPAVLNQLEGLRKLLVNRKGMLGNLTLDEPNWDTIMPRLAQFYKAIPEQPFRSEIWIPTIPQANEGLTIPAKVNFVGKAANLYELGYHLHGSVSVITNYLRTTWLYERVRLQGGAYGGTCVFDHRSGVFSFLSYRDPNLLGTLENYAGSGGFLSTLDLNQAELTKSIIGAIGDIDTYMLPDAKGFTSMVRLLTQESDEERQKRREQVLGTTQADFCAFGALLQALNPTGLVVVMGAEEAIENANMQQPGFLTKQKVL
jgi:Zn-dependent M16 (insulinase) family peptidase